MLKHGASTFGAVDVTRTVATEGAAGPTSRPATNGIWPTARESAIALSAPALLDQHVPQLGAGAPYRMIATTAR